VAINGYPFRGKSHSEETKKKMSDAKRGMFDGNKTRHSENIGLLTE
jgi:hypothetical protein